MQEGQPLQPIEKPQPSEHSRFGIASCLSAVLLLAWLSIRMNFTLTGLFGADSISVDLRIGNILMPPDNIIVPAWLAAGLALAMYGVRERGRKRLFAIGGLVANVLLAVAVSLLVILSLVMGQSDS